MRIRARLLGLGATLVLIALVAAVPAALVTLGGSPLPDALPTVEQIRTALTTPDDGTLVLGAVQFVAWAAWAALALSVILEVISRARGAHAPRLPGLHLPQLAARQLVGAATLLFVAVPATGAFAGAAPAHAAPAVTHAAPAVTEVATEQVTPVSAVPLSAPQAAPPAPGDAGAETYTVQRGDSLSGIARDALGDKQRWPEIVALNPGVANDPDLIYAGTELRLPPSAPATTDVGARTYTVRAGDTLAGIAERELGDETAYLAIFEASKSTRQADGRYLTDPNQIDVGQLLSLPGGQGTAGEQAAPLEASTVPVVPEEPTATTDVDADVDLGPVGVVPDDATGSGSVTTPWFQHEATADPVLGEGPVPAGAAQATGAGEEVGTTAPWMLAGLTGGGAVLAGAMLLLLRRRRRSQFRARRPGRTLEAPDPVLVPVERTLTAVGEATAPTVERVDQVLRRLAASVAQEDGAMPELAAVELTAAHLVLHLSSPATLAKPWSGTQDRYHWSLPGTVPLDDVGPHEADQPAPYPLLVTIGTGDEGSVWLLNVEELHLTITGDSTFGLDFARYVAAEVACNPWSTGVGVECVGVGDELAALNPDRVQVHPLEPGDHRDPIDEVLAEAVRTVDRAAAAGVDVVTARASQSGADAWPARLVLVDATSPSPSLSTLVDLVRAHVGHTATSVIVKGEQPSAPGVIIDVGSDGRLRIPAYRLDLVAVGLTRDEAQGCAALLAQTESADAAAVPVDESATDGWRAWADHAGALREEHTLPRHGAGWELEHGAVEAAAGPSLICDAADGEMVEDGLPASDASSLLVQSDASYLAVAATTVEDLEVLAPRVSRKIRENVEEADPGLDEDVAAWFSADCPLPRLQLLGPVRATTRGKPLVKRKPYMTELLAFIALHPHGVTPSEVADAFMINGAKTREYVRMVREWLGTNPRTGDPHLPDARYSAGAVHRGTPVYEVVDLLVDLDLFRRLRVRGQARGADGIDDLQMALRLVEGRPFETPAQRRAGGGWTWLVEGDRLDEHAVVAVVDVAHLVTTHALAAGDPVTARLAAETAALAAPYEEIPKLDLAAVATAEGRHAEAHRILRDEIANRSDDDGAPPELSERTETILNRQQHWTDTRAS